jgi:hypothetical protein
MCPVFETKFSEESLLFITIIHFPQNPALGLITKGVIRPHIISSVICSYLVKIDNVQGTGTHFDLRKSLVFNLESANFLAILELNHFMYLRFLAF